MHIFTDEPAANVNIKLLGLVFLLSATFNDVGSDRINLIIIFIDIFCKCAQCTADSFISRVGQ
jgi:hypothetical protein